MRKIICNIQEGQITKRQLLELESAFKHSYAQHFGPKPGVAVLWSAIPKGQGYTEGRASRTSLVLVEVADGLNQHLREVARLEMASNWARIAEVDMDHLMITLCDETPFKHYLQMNQDRTRPTSQPWFKVATMADFAGLRN
jgi:hypothetical protein